MATGKVVTLKNNRQEPILPRTSAKITLTADGSDVQTKLDFIYSSLNEIKQRIEDLENNATIPSTAPVCGDDLICGDNVICGGTQAARTMKSNLSEEFLKMVNLMEEI